MVTVDEYTLEVKALKKSYGSTLALDGVDLTLVPGQIVALLGPNGAGKTTLVSIICGLRRSDSGSVMVKGVDALAHPQQAREHIGLAPQDMGIYPMVTVRNNLKLFAELTGMPRNIQVSEIERIAVALRLDDLLDRNAGEMSGGQKRRLHTAIALLNEPPLVLLDEPTTGADVETRSALLEVVTDLAKNGSSILYSTHYLQEVETLDATVVIIDRGKVIASGMHDELVASSGGSFVVISFDGLAPMNLEGFSVSVEGSVMTVETEKPGREAAGILAALGTDSSRVQGIEIIRPSLETAYLSLTGRRFDEGELVDVTAS